MLQESSFMLLEDINSTGFTYDRHLRSQNVYSPAHRPLNFYDLPDGLYETTLHDGDEEDSIGMAQISIS